MKIQRADTDENGCNFFGGYFADGVSPFWVMADKALEFTDGEALVVKNTIAEKYGYKFNDDLEAQRREILSQMKEGTLSKEVAISKLKDLQPKEDSK